MKHLKKLLAMLLVVAMVASMIPAVLASDDGLLSGFDFNDGTELNTENVDAVWAEIESMYDAAAKKDGSVENPAAVAQKAAAIVEASDNYVEGSLSWNGNGAFTWETTDGIPCLYNTQLQQQRAGDELEKLGMTKSSVDVYDMYDSINTLSDITACGLNKIQTNVYGKTYGSSEELVCVFAPYYGIDNHFTNAYIINAIDMAKAIQGGVLVFVQTAATLDMIAQAMDQAKVIMIDTHGTTDYSSYRDDTGYPMYETGIEDYTSRANTSYICLKTNSTFTSADVADVSGPYGTYWHAASAGSGTYAVDGTAIANHMKADKDANGFAWIGSCLGMSTNGIGTPLVKAGVNAVYGYSQSVTFFGDVVYLSTFTDKLVAGSDIAGATNAMKAAYGYWDPYYKYWYTFTYSDYYGSGYFYDYYPLNNVSGYTFYPATLSMVQKDKAAFPIVVSSQDVYPGQGKVDNLQAVKSNWLLRHHGIFHDVINTWYTSAIEYVAAHGLMNGNGDGSFGPNATLTRAQAVVILHNMAGNPQNKTSAGFTDLTAGWYTTAVNWAAENGIVNGIGHNKFAPNENVTREQFAAFLHRYAAYTGSSTTGNQANLSGFSDAGQISSWAKPSVQWAVAEGILTGNNNQLMPQGTASRSQVATMIMRYVQ